jgi:hypothetical protein
MQPAYRTNTPLPALGMTSLVLGVIAMVLAPLPVLGIPLSVCGIVSGVIGFIAAFTVPGTYFRWAVGGLAASVLALGINLALAYAPEGYLPDKNSPTPWQPVPDRPAAPPPAHSESL